MPPCALAELQAWSVVFVAIATRAPVLDADTAAASPAAPLPITSTSSWPLPRMGRIVADGPYVCHYRSLSNSYPNAGGLDSPAHGNPGRDRQADIHHRRPRGHA